MIHKYLHKKKNEIRYHKLCTTSKNVPYLDIYFNCPAINLRYDNYINNPCICSS